MSSDGFFEWVKLQHKEKYKKNATNNPKTKAVKNASTQTRDIGGDKNKKSAFTQTCDYNNTTENQNKDVTCQTDTYTNLTIDEPDKVSTSTSTMTMSFVSCTVGLSIVLGTLLHYLK
jgi:hypothetical protein